MIPSQYDPAVLTADQADSIFCFYNDLPVALGVQGIEYSTMLLADFGYNPASQVYTVLTESLEGDTRDAGAVACCGPRSWAGRTTRPTSPRPPQLAVDMYPDAGLDLETQQVQAEVQLDIMYSDVTDENGFAWFTDETHRQQRRTCSPTSASPGPPRRCSTARCSRRSTPTGRRSDDRSGHWARAGGPTVGDTAPRPRSSAPASTKDVRRGRRGPSRPSTTST